MLTLVFGRLAEEDLDKQSAFLAQERGLSFAQNWLLEVIEVAEGLCVNPELGRVILDGALPARMLSHRRRFTLVYIVKKSDIVILRVYGRGQNIEELLF